MKKTKETREDREIQRMMQTPAHPAHTTDDHLYFPGGRGGGGNRRGTGQSVVLPHAKTSPGCTLCGRMHSRAEHERHGEPPPRIATEKKSRAKAKAKAPSGTKKKAQAKKKMPASNLPIEVTVRRAISEIGPRARFGEAKIFISDLWREVKKHEPILTLDGFKNWLRSQFNKQRIRLARADLVSAMNPRKVKESEMRDDGETFHFVIDEDRDANLHRRDNIRREQTDREIERMVTRTQPQPPPPPHQQAISIEDAVMRSVSKMR